MSENLTQPTTQDARDLCEAVEHKTRREDALMLLDIFQEITGEPPVVWGTGKAGTMGIVGYGQYTYKYETGREGTMLRSGFSPRKANLVMYIMTGFKAHPALMDTLGKYKSGASCLYVTRLANIDMDVLKQLIKADWDIMAAKYPI